jgi:predicted DNA-binding transcriptional regulator AlpA
MPEPASVPRARESSGRWARVTLVRNNIPAGDHLVGLAELAIILGRSRPATCDFLRCNRDRFPRPIVVLACGPVWLRSAVLTWVGEGAGS